MQNEFEKQVKRKMEELDFVPSAPVWQKIEEQIRQKKDKKRFALLLPLILLLIGGSIAWYLINKNMEEVEQENISLQKEKIHPITNNTNEQVIPGQDIAEETPGQEIVNHNPTNEPLNDIENVTGNTRHIESIIKQGQVGGENKLAGVNNTKDLFRNKSQPDITAESRIHNSERAIAEILLESEHENSLEYISDLSVKPIMAKPILSIAANAVMPGIKVIESASVLKNEKNPDSNAIAAIELPSKKFGRSKWKLGFSVNAGISGAGEGLPLGLKVYSNRQSVIADANFATLPPASLYNRDIQPSSIENGFSYGAGLVARKQLSSRFAFQTGLQYQYLSNHLKIGFRSASLSIGNSPGLAPVSYTSGSLQNFKNSFHFISIPAMLDFQLLKRKPLKVQGGISYRHLLHTNALHYNNLSKLYYHDSKAFHSNQYFAELGLSYSFPIMKMKLTAGPHIQYSLKELEKNNSVKHLVYAGLNFNLFIN